MAKVEKILKNQNIIVVDDSDITRQSLKLRFEEYGATVYTTGQIKKCIAHLDGLVLHHQQLPKLIVIDVRLPGSYGLKPLYKIQEALRGNHIPIVVASRGFNSLAMNSMALLDVIGYLEKPVRIDTLVKFSIETLTSIQINHTAIPDTIQKAA